MTMRRNLVATASLATAAAPFRSALVRAEAQQKIVDFLFVQTAHGMTFDKSIGTLKLTGVSPATTVFSDCPERRCAYIWR
jgi:hypothetical protein